MKPPGEVQILSCTCSMEVQMNTEGLLPGHSCETVTPQVVKKKKVF